MKHSPLLAMLLLVLLQAVTRPAQAQSSGRVGIGTSTPHASAVLDLTAPDKGLLVPRLDSVARVGIASPATGLLVFQTSPRPGFYYYGGSGKGWLFLADQARAGDNLGNHAATRALDLGGQALVGRGENLGAGVVGVGVRADGGLNLGQNTPGNNIFLGYQSGYSNTTGRGNLFSGYLSGYSNTEGSGNVFSGYRSGVNNITGDNNLFIGNGSGFDNTEGSYNQFSGYLSGASNTTGSENQFIGYQSGQNNTTGNKNWAFGYRAGPTAGNLTNAGAIGYQAQVSQSNTLVLGGTGANAVRVGIGTTAPAATLDVAGSAQVSGKVSTTATGAANMLAAGYGNVYGVGTLLNASANVAVAHTAGSGEYVLTFTGPLATADFGSTAVTLTLFNGPGFVSYASGGAGRLLVRTYTPGGALTDRGFSFVVFQP